MVLIAYMQCPIFKFERLFPPEISFPWVFLSFEKIGIHCAIVPFSCPPLRNDVSIHHNMAFVWIYQVSHVSMWRKRGRL